MRYITHRTKERDTEGTKKEERGSRESLKDSGSKETRLSIDRKGEMTYVNAEYFW